MLKQSAERMGERLVKRDAIPCNGVDERDMRRVQRKAPGQRAVLRTVKIIARNRAADVRKVYADLMRSAGFKAQADQRAAAVFALHAVMRYGALPVFAHGALRTLTEPGNGRVNRTLRRLRHALRDSKVFADKAAGMQLRG